MKTSSAGIRAKAAIYAEVLLEAAQATDEVFVVAGQFDELVTTVKGSIELRNALTEETLPHEAKKEIIAGIFTGYAPALLTIFLVMVERDDLAVLTHAYDTYVSLAEEALAAIIIDVTTVVPLDDALREKIIQKYSMQLGTGVLLREHVDSQLVGGIILSTHGKRIDASVSSQLENARQVLSRT